MGGGGGNPPGGAEPPGGGAGGGPGPRGPGGGQGFTLPFARAAGLGATSRLLTGGFTAGLAVDAAEEVAFLPQEIGRLEGGALASSRPYMDLTEQSYAFARAVGGPQGYGDRTLRSVFPGGYQTPEWMSALGLGPGSATRMAGQFGMLPAGVDEREGLIRGLGTMDFLPGTSGVGNEARASARQAALYGAISPTEGGVRNYGMQLSEVMENAISKGMDRASVLRSIDASVAMAARSGAMGVSTTGLQDFIMRFSNLPGGRTGEAGLQAMSGLQGAMGTIGSSPIRTMMAVQAGSQIHNEGDLAKLLGQDNYSKVAGTPEGRTMIQNFLQANRSGNTWASAMYLQALTEGNPEAQARVLNQQQFYRGLPSYMQPLVAGKVTGLGTAGQIAYNQNPQGLRSPGGDQAMIGSGELSYNKDKMGDYRAGLARMGIPAQYIDAIMTQAASHGVSPVLMGAVMMQEHPSNWQGNLMQITPGDAPRDPRTGLRMAPNMDPMQSIALGAEHLQRDLQSGRGDLHNVLQAYNGPRMDQVNPNYVSNVAANMTVGGANVPADMLRDRASIEQAQMAGSATSFAEMNLIVPAVNSSLANLTAAANSAAIALGRIGRNGAPGTAQSYAPMGQAIPQ